MTLMQKTVLCALLCLSLSACGGKGELGPATTTPKVDPKQMEDFRRQSMERGNLKVDPTQNQPPAQNP